MHLAHLAGADIVGAVQLGCRTAAEGIRAGRFWPWCVCSKLPWGVADWPDQRGGMRTSKKNPLRAMYEIRTTSQRTPVRRSYDVRTTFVRRPLRNPLEIRTLPLYEIRTTSAFFFSLKKIFGQNFFLCFSLFSQNSASFFSKFFF